MRNDPEYLENWVSQLGLLCQTDKAIGWLGSSYFLGIISTMVFVPVLTDTYGRKSIFVITMLTSIIGQIGLLYSTSLSITTFFVFMIGATWPGKRVTGLNYILEFMPTTTSRDFILVFTLFDYPSVYLLSTLYQHVDPSWYP